MLGPLPGALLLLLWLHHPPMAPAMVLPRHTNRMRSHPADWPGRLLWKDFLLSCDYRLSVVLNEDTRSIREIKRRVSLEISPPLVQARRHRVHLSLLLPVPPVRARIHASQHACVHAPTQALTLASPFDRPPGVATSLAG